MDELPVLREPPEPEVLPACQGDGRANIMVAESTNSTSQTRARKAYQKPTLVKATVLAAITADTLISPAPGCWVARAAFGEADIRWMIFRSWLLEDAPLWFRWLYISYGELIGSWLSGRESARSVVRALMMPAINRKLRSW
jgi:hypothetical protein